MLKFIWNHWINFLKFFKFFILSIHYCFRSLLALLFFILLLDLCFLCLWICWRIYNFKGNLLKSSFSASSYWKLLSSWESYYWSFFLRINFIDLDHFLKIYEIALYFTWCFCLNLSLLNNIDFRKIIRGPFCFTFICFIVIITLIFITLPLENYI